MGEPSNRVPAVFRAINAVANDLSQSGIGKNHRNQHQKFNFRGIDDVYAALSRPLVEHGLRILPRVTSRETVERKSKNDGALFATVVTVDYDFVAVEDGSRYTVTVIGEAMDSGDKSCSKSLSMAFKYACFQAFCIPVEGEDDADATTHEVAPRQISKAGAGHAPTGVQSLERAPASDALKKVGTGPMAEQLDILLNIYGAKRATFEKKIAEAMGLKSLAELNDETTPQAIVRVMQHQKVAAARKGKPEKEAEKPAVGLNSPESSDDDIPV